MVTPPHSGGRSGGVATPSSVGSEPAPPDEAAAVLAAIAAASLHTLEPACLCTSPSAYIRVPAHACYSVYMRASAYRRACTPSSGVPRCWNGSTRPPSRRDIYTYTGRCMYTLVTRPPSRRHTHSYGQLSIYGQPHDLFARVYDLFAHAHAHRRTRCSPRGSDATRRETSGSLTNLAYQPTY